MHHHHAVFASQSGEIVATAIDPRGSVGCSSEIRAEKEKKKGVGFM